jgi:hypothetical protein
MDWEIIVERLAKAFVSSAVAAVLAYESVSRVFVWWIARTAPSHDGQLGLGGWVAGLGAGAIAAVTTFGVTLYLSTLARRKQSD